MDFSALLVKKLIETQFPQWAHLPIKPVAKSGWDNRTFHLGEDMLIRLPSSSEYALQVEKEQQWLPLLAPALPLAIPTPLAMGKPSNEYPWHWSIYRWIEGGTVASTNDIDLCDIANNLAEFLIALQHIDATDGPLPGPHSFYRGGLLSTYDDETRQAIIALKGKIDTNAATKIWNNAVASRWENLPVWVHGDISAGNLLVRERHLCAVIDFGQLAAGDPACDLAIAWTLFQDESRNIFREKLPLNNKTWERGRGWALWKALTVAAGFTDWRFESQEALGLVNQICEL